MVLFFDLLGVVFPNKAGGSRANMESLYSQFSSKPIDFDSFYSRYIKFTLGEMSENEFWLGFGDVDNIRNSYLDGYQLYSKLSNLVTLLKVRGYRVAALTNHPSPWVEYQKKRFNLDRMFEEIFTSGRAGVRKPDIKYYMLASYDMGVHPSKCYMIDDQLKNLKGAKEAGFKTIHVKTKGDKLGFKPDFVISELGELLKLSL